MALERDSGMPSTPSWFCPFCAEQLTAEPGYLYCAKGECGFSMSVMEKFLAGRANKQSPTLFSSGTPMHWFRPACAHELNSGDVAGNFVFGCPACGMFVPAGAQQQLLHYHVHAAFPPAL
jgi:hypothetical protein